MMKKTKHILFLVILAGFCIVLCNTTLYAKTKAQQAKQAYAKYLQSTDTSKDNSFIVLDINKDGVPELLTGFVYEQSKSLNRIFTYRDGKVKELANITKRNSVIIQAEQNVTYLPNKKCLILYDGGTSNNNSMYAMNKQGKLKKIGEIGYRWYDDSCTVRKPHLNGKWISEKQYKNFFKKNKGVVYEYHRNTPKNRDKFLCKVKSKKITNLFNANGKEKILELKINSTKMQDDKIVLEGTGRCPVDVVRTSKQRKQLESGKIKALGKNWIVKKEFDEGTCITSYYLYSNSKSKQWSYTLSPVTTLLTYPNLILSDRNNKWVYKTVGKVRVVVKSNQKNSSQEMTAENAFCSSDDWKGKWCGLELDKSWVVNWLID